MTEMYFVNIPTTFSVLSLCCDVLYLFKPAFELPAVVSLNSNKLDVQLFLLSCVNHIVLMLTSIFHAQFYKRTKEVL